MNVIIHSSSVSPQSEERNLTWSLFIFCAFARLVGVCFEISRWFLFHPSHEDWLYEARGEARGQSVGNPEQIHSPLYYRKRRGVGDIKTPIWPALNSLTWLYYTGNQLLPARSTGKRRGLDSQEKNLQTQKPKSGKTEKKSWINSTFTVCVYF